jgi:hypothetical protein
VSDGPGAFDGYSGNHPGTGPPRRECHLDFVTRINLLTPADADPLLGEVVIVRRMLIVLRRRVLERTQ